MSRGRKELKPAEEWALDLIKPGIEDAFPEGYDVVVPEQDPPDCIVKSITDNRRQIAIEFSAMGPAEIFEFYNVGLRKEPPYISRISIPYEPEYWLEQLLKKKEFETSSKYSVLCTHFCSHFALPGWPTPKHSTKRHEQVIHLTPDMVGRFQTVIWNKGLNDDKTVLFVRPGTKTLNLSIPHEPDPVREIDISDGYPTVQLLAMNVPLGEMIDYSKIPALDLVIRPNNPKWDKPDDFRIPLPKPQRYFVKNEATGEEVPGVFIMQMVGPSMPKIRYIDL